MHTDKVPPARQWPARATPAGPSSPGERKQSEGGMGEGANSTTIWGLGQEEKFATPWGCTLGGNRRWCDGMSDRCPEREMGLSDCRWQRTETQGKPSFLVSAVWGRAAKSNKPEKPAQIAMIMHISNTSPCLLIVLKNENVLLWVQITSNSSKLITSGVLIVDYGHLIYKLKIAYTLLLWNIYCPHMSEVEWNIFLV